MMEAELEDEQQPRALLDYPASMLTAILKRLPLEDLGCMLACCSTLRRLGEACPQWGAAVEALNEVNKLDCVYGHQQFHDKSDAELEALLLEKIDVNEEDPVDVMREMQNMYIDGEAAEVGSRGSGVEDIGREDKDRGGDGVQG